MGICIKEDDFLEDKSYWIATLSNGVVVYGDDGRPGETVSSAWLRLTQYLVDNCLTIVKFGIKFRDHYEELPSNKDGYYFSHGVLGGLFCEKNISYQVLGYVEDDMVWCWHYITPSLVRSQITSKGLDRKSPCLFINRN